LKYYPVFLDIAGRTCVVIGGGEVACRKVHRLLECGARVTVVSVELCPDLAALKTQGTLTHIADRYAPEHLHGAFLVVGATDSGEVNTRIFHDARTQRILVNIVDEPERCDFILPSLVERGDLTIAVSTGGQSPALAKQLRRELEAIFGEEYETYLRIMGDVRAIVLARGSPSEENRRIFESLVQSDLLSRIRHQDWVGVRRLVHEIVAEPVTLRLP
jgi:precorrin-2 dehydrogenase/sirohydrochlorin ferrochelatase